MAAGKDELEGLTGGAKSQEQTKPPEIRRIGPPPSKWKSFLRFIYDPQQKKFLGRGGRSWLEITIFYIIFYSCLAAFWAICLAGFVYTLDDKLPRFYGKGTIIGINPGMGYQPWMLDDPDSTLIYIKLGRPNSYKPYVERLNTFLERYDNQNDTRPCTGAQSNADPDYEKLGACRFIPQEHLGPCASADYGYAAGEPCVILTLNRLIDWRPLRYPEGSDPSVVMGRYEPGDIAIYCHGANDVDEEHMMEVNYYPRNGIEGKYYPYRVMPNYHQPIAAAKFSNLKHNVINQIECLAYAYNIIHDPKDRQGLIQFEVFIDDFIEGEPQDEDESL